MKTIKLDHLRKLEINTIAFSNNSRYLLVGDYRGCLYCYDINNN